MKRPVTLVLVASMLVGASALAGPGAGKQITERVVAARAARDNGGNHGNDRGHDNRGNDNRGNGNRGNDNRGNDNRGNDHRGGNTQHNNNEHDRGNHAPPSYGRTPDRRDDHHDNRGPGNNGHDWNDHRNDNNRHDWNDHRNDNNRHDNNGHDWNDRRNDNNRHDNNGHNYNGNRGWDRPRSDWSNHPNYWDNRRHDRRDYARYRFNNGYYRAPYGYQYRTWHRGDYLPHSYYSSSYIVYDWRPYRLYEPPYGYHWVRVGNDVLLTALATGVVLDVLYNIWY